MGFQSFLRSLFIPVQMSRILIVSPYHFRKRRSRTADVDTQALMNIKFSTVKSQMVAVPLSMNSEVSIFGPEYLLSDKRSFWRGD
jgi:hypothetical protein